MLHKYILEWGKKILFVVHWGLNSKSIDKAWLVLFTGVEHETWPHSQVVVTNNVFRGIKQFCNHGNSPKSAQPTLGSKTTFVAQQPRPSHHTSEMLNKKILLILQMPTSISLREVWWNFRGRKAFMYWKVPQGIHYRNFSFDIIDVRSPGVEDVWSV